MRERLFDPDQELTPPVAPVPSPPVEVTATTDALLYGRGLGPSGARHVSSRSGTAGLSIQSLPSGFGATTDRVQRREKNWNSGEISLSVAGCDFRTIAVQFPTARRSRAVAHSD